MRGGQYLIPWLATIHTHLAHQCAQIPTSTAVSSAPERAHCWPNEIRPAARWRLAKRARWLAGRARASSQSQIYACMHDLI